MGDLPFPEEYRRELDKNSQLFTTLDECKFTHHNPEVLPVRCSRQKDQSQGKRAYQPSFHVQRAAEVQTLQKCDDRDIGWVEGAGN